MINELEWEIAEPLIQRAIDTHGGYTLEDVRSELEDNRAELWVFGDCAMVTKVKKGPLGRDLHVWLAAGVLEQLQLGLPQLDQIARELGCSRVTVDGRKGWAKALTGYRVERVFLAKEIAKGYDV